MKSSNIKPLKSCPMCEKNEVFASYEENARYRYKCNHCGQYIEFNAPSQFAADIIFNDVIRGRIHKQTEGVWIITYHLSHKKSPRGRQIKTRICTCDVCGKSNGRQKSNFCPNCGARMIGGDK